MGNFHRNLEFSLPSDSELCAVKSARHQTVGGDRQIKPTHDSFTELSVVAIRSPELLSLIHAKEISGCLISRGGKKGGYFKTISVILTAAALS